MNQLVTTKMTKRKEEFCINYLMHGNIKKAALEAGYSEATATVEAFKWLNREPMKSYIEERRARQNLKVNASREWKIQKLMEIIENALQGAEVMDAQGNVKRISDNRAAIAAIAELNKMAGDYAPQKHENVNLNMDVDVKRVEELIKTKFKSEY